MVTLTENAGEKLKVLLLAEEADEGDSPGGQARSRGLG